MSIEIKKIYLENYKLFTLKEIEFSEYLSVFDGPNGYGKTSIFDAIEFLITGTISRIKESDVIAGNVSYSQNCLANDSKQDIRLKAEFLDVNSKKNIVIALRVPASTGATKQNNPKNIELLTESYVLPQYDTPVESWGDYYVDYEDITAKRKAFFGEQNINLFKMLHYIHQEDRLAYFKKSESERAKTITDLFGIEEDISKLGKLNDAQRQLSARVKSLKDSIDQIGAELDNLPKSDYDNVPYEALVDGKRAWDQEILSFNGAKSKALFEQLKSDIRDLIAFIENKDAYLLSSAIQKFDSIHPNFQSYAIHGWILSKQSPDVLENINTSKENLDFLTKQLELLNDNNFVNVDWKKINTLIEFSDSIEIILEYVEEVKKAEKNQSDLKKLSNSFYQARQTFDQRRKNFEGLSDGLCPYCGYHWETESKLQEQFSSTSILLEDVLGSGDTIYKQAIQKCKNYYEEFCKMKLSAYIEKLNSYPGLQILLAFNSYKDFKIAIDNCEPILKVLQANNELFSVNMNNDLSITEHLEGIVSAILKLKSNIPSNYYALAEQHGFDKVYKECFNNNNHIDNLTVEKLKNKEKYIESQYYTSFNQTRQQLESLKLQEVKLSALQSQMKEYHTSLKKAIDSYQQLVIKQIEIPFFLYCSRLLQSYQGGQGVLIDSKDSKIRFTAPGAEHDVLYTMSSGQLSAVLLAFSLVLNKIYSGESFNTLFIDDPIQCMDDINMISFVELLRREFSDAQIIISTHEDTFANYVKYKFAKYNLKSQSITLKDES